VVELFPSEESHVQAADPKSAASSKQQPMADSSKTPSRPDEQRPMSSGLSPLGCRRLEQSNMPDTLPPSAYVSLSITERYRPSLATASTSNGGEAGDGTVAASSASAIIAAMPPIRSGREYRNQMRSRYLERKDKGMIAPSIVASSSSPSAHPSPHPPSRSEDAAISRLISPAAQAILRDDGKPAGATSLGTTTVGIWFQAARTISSLPITPSVARVYKHVCASSSDVSPIFFEKR
jgi:hypothetical protein